MTAVTPSSEDRKRKYFNFYLQTEDDEMRVVSFSPEKHKLLQKIEHNNTGCELKKFRYSDKHEIIINHNTLVREIQPTFRKIERKPKFFTVAHINNESQVYEIVNVTAIIYNVSPIEIVETEDKTHYLRKATLQDTTDKIPVTIFGDLVNNELVNTVEENPITIVITELRVSQYMNTRLLKTTEASTITESLRNIYVPRDEMEDANFAIVDNAKITSVELASLQEKLLCSRCRNTVEKVVDSERDKDDDDQDSFYVCNNCSRMTNKDGCKKLGKVIFTAKIGNSHMRFNANPSIITSIFQVPLKQEIKLAMSMIKTEVIVKYSKADLQVVSMRKV